jgi:hypothetical protein
LVPDISALAVIRRQLDEKITATLDFAREMLLPTLDWLKLETRNDGVHARIEDPAMRNKITKIIARSPNSTLFSQFEEHRTSSCSGRREIALQVVSR